MTDLPNWLNTMTAWWTLAMWVLGAILTTAVLVLGVQAAAWKAYKELKGWPVIMAAMRAHHAGQRDAECDITEVESLHRELSEAKDEAAFYRRRCNLLQEWQSRMRDPERTIVCDILANAQTLPDLDGARYGQPKPNTYASTQATKCAGCGEHKHTPLRIDAMGGYVCLTCIDQKLGGLLGEFGYPEPAVSPSLPPCHIAVIGFRFDGVAQTHVPQLLIEFEAVPAGAPNSSKGWADRDALVGVLTDSAAQEASHG